VSSRAERLVRRLPTPRRVNRGCVVGVDALRRSLVDDPVDGVDIPL
jgi:hypothetical protein